MTKRLKKRSGRGEGGEISPSLSRLKHERLKVETDQGGGGCIHQRKGERKYVGLTTGQAENGGKKMLEPGKGLSRCKGMQTITRMGVTSERESGKK